MNMPENPKVIVERCGVVNINKGSSAHIRVNSDDLIAEIYNKIFDEINPIVDWDSNFAGKVTITVEVLGELKEE